MAAEDAEAATSIVERFSENEEVLKIINDLRNPEVTSNEISMESGIERLTVILDQYQEQPHLLDPYLEQMITPLLEISRSPGIAQSAFHQAFKYLYLITKTRGAKYVVRMFTHEVADLEPILTMLKQQNPFDFKTWETRYILLLWLSIICMIPFDLTRLDGTSANTEKSIIDRILNTAKEYLGVVDKSRDAASLLLAKFVTRPDVKKRCLAEFLDWSLVMLVKSDDKTMPGMNLICGIASTLAQLFKHGKRDDLLEYVLVVFEKIEEQNYLNRSSTLLKKLTMKVIQRLGLTLLKPRVAAWRYQRGNRSLLFNLENPFSAQQQQNVFSVQGEEQVEESYDIPEHIELVLEQLLLGLRDRDTVVRWSAAKGIGRLTSRLPKELADDIIGSLLEFFSLQESDSGWHGGCLALAELGKRGLLLPDRLPEVVPVVLKALLYDEKRGSSSVGAHVRDAACYTCWSFARAYDPKDLKKYVTDIACSLIIVAVFDREVNCRRAASAAFQENVGRQGTFPHGIDIVILADYFAVGNRMNCFHKLSIEMAKFPEYTQPLIDHLAEVKVAHWDNTIRIQASQTLYNMTALAPDYMKNKVLPKLLDKTNSIDFNTRHGSIIAAAEITHALCIDKSDPESILGRDIIKKLKEVIPNLNLRNQFRGFAGDFMKTAACKLIEKLSMSKMPFHDDPVIDVWLDIIDESLCHTIPSIQQDGVNALAELCQEFSKNSDGTLKLDFQAKLLDKHFHKLKSTLQFDRMGFALGLGGFPKFLLHGKLDKVTDALLASMLIEDTNAGVYAESRRDAILALTRISGTVGLEVKGDPKNTICKDNINLIFDGFLKSMNDYTTDSRGDVGSWVREAAMTGLERLTILAVQTDPSLITDSWSAPVMCSLSQQVAEKICRTRDHAGDILLKLIHFEPRIPGIPHHKELTEMFPKSEVAKVYWSLLTVSFPRITQFLSLSAYRHSVLLGLTVSVGGLTESLVRHSSDSLLQYLRSIQDDVDALEAFAEEILEIFKKNKKNDRVMIPMFKMLDLLLSNGIFDFYLERENSPFPMNLYTSMREEIFRSGDAKKLINSINVFCALVQFPGEARKKSLSQLMTFLCHKYPRVRKGTAENLYTAIVTFEEIVSEDNMDELLLILSETNWDGQIQELREQRNIICHLLGVPKPKLKTSAAAANKETAKTVDDLESYRDLVSRHGF